MSKGSKDGKKGISSTKVFISVVLWGLAIIACMYVGSFIVSALGNIIYYGALFIVSIFMVRYVEKRLKVKQ